MLWSAGHDTRWQAATLCSNYKEVTAAIVRVWAFLLCSWQWKGIYSLTQICRELSVSEPWARRWRTRARSIWSMHAEELQKAITFGQLPDGAPAYMEVASPVGAVAGRERRRTLNLVRVARICPAKWSQFVMADTDAIENVKGGSVIVPLPLSTRIIRVYNRSSTSIMLKGNGHVLLKFCIVVHRGQLWPIHKP